MSTWLGHSLESRLLSYDVWTPQQKATFKLIIVYVWVPKSHNGNDGSKDAYINMRNDYR